MKHETNDMIERDKNLKQIISAKDTFREETNNRSSIESYTSSQINIILNKYIFDQLNNEKLNNDKNKIIKCIKDNKLNGSKVIKMSIKPFQKLITNE